MAPWPRGPVALFLPFGSSMSFHVAMPLWQHVPNMCQHVGRHHAVPSVAIATHELIHRSNLLLRALLHLKILAVLEVFLSEFCSR